MDIFNSIPENAGPQTRAFIKDASDKIQILKNRGLVDDANVLSARVVDALKTQDFNLFQNSVSAVNDYYAKAPKPEPAKYVEPVDIGRQNAETAASISAINDLMTKSIASGNKVDKGLADTITSLAKYDPNKAMELATKSMPILETKQDVTPKKTEANITFEQNAAAALRYADTLAEAINKYGTFETYNSEGSAVLKQLPYQMAISYAKLVDPNSVAREGEVASAEKYLIPLGLFTREDTAKAALKNFRDDIVSRVKQYKESTGKEMAVDTNANPAMKKPEEPTVSSSNSYFDKFKSTSPQK
jgi:hypothetical protein